MTRQPKAKDDVTKRARDRGKHDAERERAPIFRSTRAFGIIPQVDDPGADDWTEEARAAYLEGYYGCP